jgi:uncharacterized membrane protein
MEAQMRGYTEWGTLATALGCGLSAGVFFAFSSFVMPALDRLTPAEGIRAMNSINKLAVTPLFMTAFIGTAIGCAGLGIWAVRSWGERPSMWVLAGGVLYLVGAFGVTVVANVPLNDALAAVDPGAADAASAWNSYVGDWTNWNHVRTVAALGAAGLLTIAMRVD